MKEIHIIKCEDMSAFMENMNLQDDGGAALTKFFERDGELFVAVRFLDSQEVEEARQNPQIIDLLDFVDESGHLKSPEDLEDPDILD